jgi:hypothetical protein
MAVMYEDPVGLMPPYSQIDPNTTNQFGDGGSAQGASPSGLSDEPLPPNIELGSQPTPSTSSQPRPQASPDSSLSTSNSQALGRPNRLPPPKMTSSHQKTTVHFAMAVGIIAAVVALLVIVGAFLAGRKKLKIHVRITSEYEC